MMYVVRKNTNFLIWMLNAKKETNINIKGNAKFFILSKFQIGSFFASGNLVKWI